MGDLETRSRERSAQRGNETGGRKSSAGERRQAWSREVFGGVVNRVGFDRARRGASGALNPQSA